MLYDSYENSPMRREADFNEEIDHQPPAVKQVADLKRLIGLSGGEVRDTAYYMRTFTYTTARQAIRSIQWNFDKNFFRPKPNTDKARAGPAQSPLQTPSDTKPEPGV